MIPGEILRPHLLEAAKIIDREGIPDRRKSTKYNVLVNQRKYPPKYLVAIASKLATGKTIPSQAYIMAVLRQTDFLDHGGLQ